MSLRTKILAAIVGLNLVVLVLGVALLLLRPGSGTGPRVPAAILRPLGRVWRYPGETPREPNAPDPRDEALRELERAPNVESVVVLEDAGADTPPRARGVGGRPPPAADVGRARAMYADARRVREWQVGERELA